MRQGLSLYIEVVVSYACNNLDKEKIDWDCELSDGFSFHGLSQSARTVTNHFIYFKEKLMGEPIVVIALITAVTSLLTTMITGFFTAMQNKRSAERQEILLSESAVNTRTTKHLEQKTDEQTNTLSEIHRVTNSGLTKVQDELKLSNERSIRQEQQIADLRSMVSVLTANASRDVVIKDAAVTGKVEPATPPLSPPVSLPEIKIPE